MRKGICGFGLVTFVAGGILVACGSDAARPPTAPAADGGIDAAVGDGGSEAGDAGSDAATDALVTSEAGDDASPEDAADEGATRDAGEGGIAPDDGGAEGSPDASDGSVDAGPESAFIGYGSLLGVTSDGFVVWWSSRQLAVSPVAGGGAHTLVLSSRAYRPKVAGSRVLWGEIDSLDAGACLAPTGTVHSWTASGGGVQVASTAPGMLYAPSADGARIAYFTDCTAQTIALAQADGSGTPLTVKLATPPASVPTLQLVGSTVIADLPDGTEQVFAGAPLAGIASLTAGTGVYDPTGEWLWKPASPSGRELVRTADGVVVFTDPAADAAAMFDGAGGSAFYAAQGALEQISLASPSSATTLVVSGVSALAGVAKNGGAVLFADSGDGGSAFHVRTTGAGGATFSLPAEATGPFFTSDSSSVVWLGSAGSSIGPLEAEPIAGGTIATLAADSASLQGSLDLGAGQIFFFDANQALVVDATGKVPTAILDPAPAAIQPVETSSLGGVVAYAAYSGLYARLTR